MKYIFNLVPAIQEIKKEINKIKSQYEAKLKPYEDSLELLRELNKACETCNGTGEVFKRECAEDDGQYITCSKCNGIGAKKGDV